VEDKKINYELVDVFALDDLSKFDTKELIDMAATKKAMADRISKEFDILSTELQARAVAFQEDRHLKFSEWFGNKASAGIAVTQKLDILNLEALKFALGSEIVEDKIKRKVEIKFDVDKKFKQAIIALITKDYISNMSIEDVIKKAGWGASDINKQVLLSKKLKGDYKADKKSVSQVLNIEPEKLDIDEELYFIYQIKNYHLIRAFFDKDKLFEVTEMLRNYTAVNETPKIAIKAME
jgi:hypothetical protein